MFSNEVNSRGSQRNLYRACEVMTEGGGEMLRQVRRSGERFGSIQNEIAIIADGRPRMLVSRTAPRCGLVREDEKNVEHSNWIEPVQFCLLRTGIQKSKSS